MSIDDVWKNSYSENTSRKVWAAKYVARHPNLVALELSSFKCGHDAPIYSVVEEIVEHSGTPYFCFKDIDENKPTGSIRIRVETIRLLPEAVPRRHGEEQEEGHHHRAAASGVRSAAEKADAAGEAGG
jgi:predicted nucleotide-binding protein (sugar kinase/HSP70/actin superfamily)